MANLDRMIDEIIDAWNRDDSAVLQRHYGLQAVFSDPIFPDGISGQAIIDYSQAIHAAFADVEFVVHAKVIAADVAMVEWTQVGTNSGAMLGRPATHRYIEIPAVSVVKFDGDRLASHRDYWDAAKLMQDLYGDADRHD